MATSLVAELAEKLSSATNNFDIDESTIFVNTLADTVGIGTDTPASKLDVRGTMQVGVNETGYDVKFFGSSAGAFVEYDVSTNELEIRGPSGETLNSSKGKLLLSTAETTVVDGNKLGQIDFQAPLDQAGSDAILVGASIWAEADATFSATVNSTELVFATGASETATEKMRIDSAGNVGIGTPSPSHVLEINHSNQGMWGLYVNGTASSSGIGAHIETTTDDSGHALRVSTGAGASRFVVTNEGNVGIGTTTPDSALHINQTGSAYALHVACPTNTTNYGNGIAISILDENTTSFPLYINTNSVDEESGTVRFAVRADGNVGIGTSAPNGKIDISSTSDCMQSILSYSDTSSERGRIRFNKSHSDTHGTLVSTVDTEELGSIEWYGVNGSNASTTAGSIRMVQEGSTDNRTPCKLVFATGENTAAAGTNVDRMVIDKSGNVGIGTTAPGTQLHLMEEGANLELKLQTFSDTETHTNYISFFKADGTAGSPGLVDDDCILGGLTFYGYDGSNYHEGALIKAQINGTPSDGTDMPTELVFSTTADGAGSPTQRMVILPSGNVGIGTTAPASLLDVQGANTTGNVVNLESSGNALTTGGVLSVWSDSNTADARSLVQIHNDNASSTGALGMKIQQDGPAYALHLTCPTNANNFGNGLAITAQDENTGSFPLFISGNTGTVEAGNVKLVVRADGKVGIGTNSPDTYLFHLKKNNTDTSIALGDETDNHFVIQNGDVASNNTGRFVGMQFTINSASEAAARAGIYCSYEGNGDSDLNFWTAEAATKALAMTIDQGGNVGIGTSAPAAQLMVKGTHGGGGNSHINVTSSSAGNTEYGGIQVSGSTGKTLYMTVGDTSMTSAGGYWAHADAATIAATAGVKLMLKAGATDNNGITIHTDGMVGINETSPTAMLYINASAQPAGSFRQTGAGEQTLYVKNSSGSFTNNMQYMSTELNDSSAANFIYCSDYNDGKMKVTTNGDGYWHGSADNGDADYAEYFEADSDNSSAKILHGTTVVLINGKIRPATSGEQPIGIIRPHDGVALVGNSAWSRWQRKGLRDDYGKRISEEYTTTVWTDADGVLRDVATDELTQRGFVGDKAPPVDAVIKSENDDGTKLTRNKQNPDWDNSYTYVQREDRPEWNIVGLLGQIPITKGQPTNSNWIKMWDISDTVEMWFVK